MQPHECDKSEGTGPLRVLLVDDDETIHDLLEVCLDSNEYSLTYAMDVDQAVKALAADLPDIVITDAVMPGASGFSLITKMKEGATTADIPVILWTMLELANGEVRDSSGKADIRMSKPFNLPNIMHSLSTAKEMIKPEIGDR